MYARCLFCEKPFPNFAFDRFACGRRVAFDAARGRIWSICDHCHRWNLCPTDERREAIYAFERLARDEGYVVAKTANAALLYTDEHALLRVGDLELAEEAWWRYGRELRRRHRSYSSRGSRLSAYSFAAIAAVSESIGLTDTGIRISWDDTPIADVMRWRHFSWAAWHGRVPCPSCSSVLLAVRFDLSWWIHPLRGQDGRLAAGVPCDRCDPWTPDKVYRIEGDDAEHLLRRVLAYQQVAGASDLMLRDAVSVIRSAGSAAGYLATLPTGRTSLWRLGPARRLALEIALNEGAEHRFLDGVLRELELRWAEENEIARIVDDELTPLP
ncbi:MAG: hypothetical protein ACRELX_14740 [Longimicrobiales bacterium]